MADLCFRFEQGVFTWHKHMHKHKKDINLCSCDCVDAYVKWKPAAQSESISPPCCFTASWWGTEPKIGRLSILCMSTYLHLSCGRPHYCCVATCVYVIVKTIWKHSHMFFFIRNIRCLPIEYRNKQCLRNVPQATEVWGSKTTFFFPRL